MANNTTIFIVGGVALLGVAIYLFMKKSSGSALVAPGIVKQLVGQPCKMADGVTTGAIATNGQCVALSDAQAVASGITSILNPLTQAYSTVKK